MVGQPENGTHDIGGPNGVAVFSFYKDRQLRGIFHFDLLHNLFEIDYAGGSLTIAALDFTSALLFEIFKAFGIKSLCFDLITCAQYIPLPSKFSESPGLYGLPGESLERKTSISGGVTFMIRATGTLNFRAIKFSRLCQTSIVLFDMVIALLSIMLPHHIKNKLHI